MRHFIHPLDSTSQEITGNKGERNTTMILNRVEPWGSDVQFDLVMMSLIVDYHQVCTYLMLYLTLKSCLEKDKVIQLVTEKT